MAEQLRNLGRFEDELRNVSKGVVSEGLYNLRDEEEREADGVLFKHPMCVLKNGGFILVTSLEEGDSNDRGNRSTQEKVLRRAEQVSQEEEELRLKHTFISEDGIPSALSPTKT